MNSSEIETFLVILLLNLCYVCVAYVQVCRDAITVCNRFTTGCIILRFCFQFTVPTMRGGGHSDTPYLTVPAPFPLQ